MTKQIQRLVNFGLGRETTRGTAEAAADFWIPKISFDFIPKVGHSVDDSGYGVIDARSASKVVTKYGEGSLGGIAYDNSLGLLLALTLGTWSTTTNTPESGVHTHAITRLNSNLHPAGTIFVKDANLDERYALGMISQFTLNALVTEHIKWTAGFLSKIGATTSQTASYTAENAFLPTHAVVKFADAIAGLGAAGAAALRSIRLTINKNPEGWQDLGSVEYADIVNKEIAVEGEMEAAFSDSTFRGYVLDGTEKACSITLTNSDVTIGTASNPVLSFELAPMAFTDWGRSGGPGDVEVQTIRFDGNFKLSDAKTISSQLINTQTSY